ncbi:bifunctional diguanylate cyclase/phosphodiesterase [Picosynechococcus sp. PCC 11901]|uniref:putative bifunctional diguanylate cyclase/phosphodiesterase n=1 Tax=unclassified Picosynechococcus TaxID=3079910 RepID=UPI0008109D97|nr:MULTISPECIES: bifunctional diguanylate cyclase/phosphodiesterase [unclassified Picosynechococcus]ANV87691.1 diguanylate cyclase [Picosynechococcus sp. PCC 7117]QCS50396.1 bifunctional diguanylate cyclase/phosphodiesterase [Picosynechococcus sp. PCC 11901]
MVNQYKAKYEKYQLNWYANISRLSRPKSYLGKIMLVAFLGTHIPLLTLFFYSISVTTLSTDTKIRVLVVALLATLIGTAVTLFTLQKLLLPISVTAKGLRKYLENNQIPKLPTHFQDEVGVLMADTLYTISKLDELIEQLKNYDRITSLPNLHLFQALLQKEIHNAQCRNQSLAVLLLDLDNFTNINTHLGRDYGNLILRTIAQQLTQAIGDNNLLAKINTDTFAIIYPHLISLEDLEKYSQKLLTIINQKMTVKHEDIYLSATMGITVYDEGKVEPQEIINQAETALNLAKGEGRNIYRFYSVETNEKLRSRFQLERDLYRALEREELELFYQPQIDVKTGNITGAEALLRWRHHEHGFISPGIFIPIAEASDLIINISDWVLKTACHQNQQWTKDGFPELCVAVNLSAKQFQQPQLVDDVSKILKETSLKPNQLELEITEGLLINNIQNAVKTLEDLHNLGLITALDDFGTGFSSLSYLKRFSLDYLKIDQSFVRGIPLDKDDVAITNSIIALAHSLQIEVIAEGVETIEQVNYLKSVGCNKLQGYYYSRPICAKDFAELWEQNLEKS